jgi:integrase
MGLSAEEVVALRWDNIDWKTGMIAIGGETPRRHPLNEPLLSLLKLRRLGLRGEVAMVLHDARGDPLSVEDLRRVIVIN